MKKSLLTKSIIAAGIVGSLTAANAGGLGDLKFYAGAGMDYNMYSFDSVLTNLVNVKSKGIGFTAPVLGIKFHENFGLEAGYSFNKKITFTNKANANLKANLKVRNIYLDLVGFMPVADQFDLLGGLGVGRLSGKADNGETDKKVSWRAKIGAQYNVVTNLALRAVFSYQNVDKNKVGSLKNVKNIGLYGVYTF